MKNRAKMQYEVEMKFPVRNRSALERILFESVRESCTTIEETDRYFQHPCRDFAKTDEGLRVRTQNFENGGTKDFLTYKGPKIDLVTKTREEIEFPFSDGDYEKMIDLWAALGFLEAGRVRKTRTTATCVIEGRECHICLDFLPDLASGNHTGTFFEIETICDQAELENARNDILRFTKTLIEQGIIGESIRKGYLEMVLEINVDCGSNPEP